MENLQGDQVRQLFQGQNLIGDYDNQYSNTYRFPYGPVAIIAPFNFPFKLAAMQMIGALISGNKVLLKNDSRTGIVMEEFIKMMIHCGILSADRNASG